MTFRTLARGSVAGLIAAGALAVAATPALAAGTVDFGLDIKGGKIALEASGKPATVKFSNLGDSTPAEVLIKFDASQLDRDAVDIDLGKGDDACKLDGSGVAVCTLDESAIPAAGTTNDLPLPLVVKDGAKRGKVGKLTVTVAVEGDTKTDNNSATLDVVLTRKSGADLQVIANDVTEVTDQGEPTGKPIAPGATSLAWGYVANNGDMVAGRLTVQVQLPEDVAFAGKEEVCTYSANLRQATCNFGDDVALIPWDEDGSEAKDGSSFALPFAVTVSKDAKGPVSLAGGKWSTVARISAPYLPELSKRAAAPAAKLPAKARKLTHAEIAKFDVDASDNTDGFNVLVAGAAGGAGGGSGTDGGGLPVTGPVAASIGGAGVAVLGVGAFLLIAARRRRIVFTSGDVK